MTNQLKQIATDAGRAYLTPEDVSEAIQRGDQLERVRLEVLEIIGTKTFGIEDASLCAYIAWKGEGDER